MKSAMVLAAGLGTRLAPLTDYAAKALVVLGDRPIASHILDRLRAASVSRVVINAHYRAQDVREFARTEPGIIVSDEPELLGTAGGVARAAAWLGQGNVLVWNGDILANPDLAALWALHEARGAEATLAVSPLPRGQGSVGTDETGRIVRLRKESIACEASGGEFIGVHVVGPKLRAGFPKAGCLVGDAYIPALRQNARLCALSYAGPFFDIGTLPRYLEANLDWLARQGTPSFVGKGVRLEASVTLCQSVVGENAVVEGRGAITRCVLWPGARAVAPLSDAIVVGRAAISAA